MTVFRNLRLVSIAVVLPDELNVNNTVEMSNSPVPQVLLCLHLEKNTPHRYPAHKPFLEGFSIFEGVRPGSYI